MAPVPFDHSVRYAPLVATGAHLTSIVYLTYAVGASLHTSYKSLGPSQDTRSRQALRFKLAPIFLALAVTAASFATYTSINAAILSYRVWADRHGLEMPNRIVGEGGFLPSTNHSSQLYIGQWLSDTPIYHDALEIVAERARRFWWGQQVDLATVAFSLLLAIEGRRRRIPMITAFLGLAHLVNLSFAQNLFYLALLLTPSPLSLGQEIRLPLVPLRRSAWRRIRDKLIPPKPAHWQPHPLLFYGALILNYGSIFVLPYAAGTQTFSTNVLVTRGSTFLPLILPKIVPARWGRIRLQPHDAYGTFAKLFRFVSAVSFLLYFKATTVALVYNAPNSHYHRHSILFPWDVEERSSWERSTTALGKVLGAIGDHPVVTAVAFDALISALSLGLWAAFRAIDVQDIIGSAIPFYNRSRPELPSLPAPPTTIIKEENPKAELEHAAEEVEPEPPATALRRSGRQRKPTRLGSIASSSGASEETMTTTGAAATRKRGRPRKPKPAAAEEESASYEPTPSESRDAVEGDVVPSSSELDWESAALVWGFTAVGGLASASAGVFGGECVSR